MTLKWLNGTADGGPVRGDVVGGRVVGRGAVGESVIDRDAADGCAVGGGAVDRSAAGRGAVGGSVAEECRTVLVVVSCVAAVERLMEVVSLVAADRRVRAVFTVVPGACCLRAGELLRARGCVVLPWARVSRREFDLVLADGSREPLRGRTLCYPDGSEWVLVRDSGAEVATIVGDIGYDRFLASIPFRAGYRRGFGVSGARKLVVATGSTVDGAVGLAARLVAALPSERYRVAAVLGADLWCAYGDWQVRAWFADCLRAGLLLVSPEEGWRAALVAADVVVGDAGPVMRYATAVGLPVLEGPPFNERSLPERIERAIRGNPAEPVTARPGRAAENLRSVMCRLLGITVPNQVVSCLPVPPAEFVDEPSW